MKIKRKREIRGERKEEKDKRRENGGERKG